MKDAIAALKKTIHNPTTTEVMSEDDYTTLYRGIFIILFESIYPSGNFPHYRSRITCQRCQRIQDP